MHKLKLTQKRALFIAVLLSLAFFAQGFQALYSQSVTKDEPSFIGSGYLNLKYGDFRMNPASPPLMQEIEALPFLFLDVRKPWFYEGMNYNPQDHESFGKMLLFQSGNDFRRITFWARLPVLLIGTLLVLSIFLWGRRLFGDAPALAGTALAAFSPNLLAHAEIATTDLGCSALMFVSVWAFWTAVQKGRKRDWALCGLATGLALFAKYTALLLVPAYLVLFGWLMYTKHPLARPSAAAKALGIVVLVSVAVIAAGYGPSLEFHRYLRGMSRLYSDHVQGYNWYLLGRVSEKPFWYYNLVGLVTKVPVSSLLLIAAAAVSLAVYRQKADAAAYLLVPAMLVIGASFFDNANLGLRRILPAFPFLFLFASYAAFSARGRLRQTAVVVLAGWTAFQAISIYPHHLSYFNTLAGGPENGPYIFDDSNVDWGQDLVYLADWQKAHPGVPLKLSYPWPAPPDAYGVDATGFDTRREIEHPGPGVYAVSAHRLVYFRKVHLLDGVDNDWLSKYRPIDRAGYSIYIYKFD